MRSSLSENKPTRIGNSFVRTWQPGAETPRSDAGERPMRFLRKLDADRVACPHVSARENDSHHTGLAHQVSLGVPAENGLHHALTEAVDLDAGVAQARHLDGRGLADMQARALRQGEEIDSARGDILAHLA